MQVKYAEWHLIYRLLVVWSLDLISDLKLLRSNVAFTLDQLLQVTFKRKWEMSFKIECAQGRIEA